MIVNKKCLNKYFSCSCCKSACTINITNYFLYIGKTFFYKIIFNTLKYFY